MGFVGACAGSFALLRSKRRAGGSLRGGRVVGNAEGSMLCGADVEGQTGWIRMRSGGGFGFGCVDEAAGGMVGYACVCVCDRGTWTRRGAKVLRCGET